MNDELLIKYFSNAATEEEVREILQWTEQSLENKKHFAELHDVWLMSKMADAHEEEQELNHIRNHITSNIANSPKPRKRIAWLKLSFAAAAAIIIALLAIDLHVNLSSRTQAETAVANTKLSANIHEIYTPKGAKANILLPDSSVVKLNSDSRIIFPDKFAKDERVVYIEGEGFFDVKSNPEAPMTVRTSNGYDVKVLGTKFNIYSYKEEKRSKTTLIEGSVDIVKSNEVIAQLTPGDSFVKEETKAIKNTNDIKQETDIAWTKDILIFDNTPLSDVIKKLKRWYGTTFIVENSNILDIRLTSEYENESIVQILESIKFSANIEYTIKDNVVKMFYK